MTDIERFKELFTDTALDLASDEIHAYNEHGDIIATLFYAKQHIEEWVGDDNVVETGENDPQEKTFIKLSAEDFIFSEYGSYEEAFRLI